jgi:hypothetical protein
MSSWLKSKVYDDVRPEIAEQHLAFHSPSAAEWKQFPLC